MNKNEYNFAKPLRNQKSDTSGYIKIAFERIAAGILLIRYSRPAGVHHLGVVLGTTGTYRPPQTPRVIPDGLEEGRIKWRPIPRISRRARRLLTPAWI